MPFIYIYEYVVCMFYAIFRDADLNIDLVDILFLQKVQKGTFIEEKN